MKIIRAIAAIAFFAAISAASVAAQPKPSTTPTPAKPGPISSTPATTGSTTGNVPDAKVALVDTDAFLDEKAGIVRRPRQMLGKQAGSVAPPELPQPLDVVFVQRTVRADRESDTVKGQRVAFPDGRQVAMRRTSRAHIVLRMHLEEADVGQRFDDGAVVLGLETDSGSLRYAIF